MTYTEALKMFGGNEFKLRNAMRCNRQQMYYFRKHLKKGIDLELTDYRVLCIETHLKEKTHRIETWQHVGDVAKKLVAELIAKEEGGKQ